MSEITLEIRNLVKTFPGFKLGPIDITAPKGAIYGLIGPNGAGKTTTIDLIMGMGAKDSGEIRVFGMDHLRDEVAFKLRTGYCSPDTNFTAWGKVKRLIGFFRSFYPDWDDDYCAGLLERFHIGWKDSIATLSFGTRIKLGLVLALAHRPDFLLLDEPLAGIDAVSKQQIFEELLEAVQDENRTVLISSHNLADIERFADFVGIIHNGKMLLEGPTAALVERYRMLDCAPPESGDTKCLDSLPGIRLVRREPDRWRVLFDTERGDREGLAQCGCAVTAETPVSLEELFVALVRED